MHRKALISQGWLRVLIFVIVFVLAILFVSRYLQPLIAASGIIPVSQNPDDAGGNQLQLFISLLLSSTLTFLLVLLFRWFVDGLTIGSLGFRWKGFSAHAFTGFFLGLLLIGAGTLTLIVTKNFQWLDLQAAPVPVFVTPGMMLIIAFAEELAFRGYILSNLLESMNKGLALVISAFIFAFFHANNPSIDLIPLVNLFLGGLLLGINYIYTKNLWFGILLHFTWNYYQGGVIGYEVSGLSLYSLLQHERTGNNWLTGGSFGFEGSVICTFVSIIALGLLAWTYEKKTKFAPSVG